MAAVAPGHDSGRPATTETIEDDPAGRARIQKQRLDDTDGFLGRMLGAAMLRPHIQHAAHQTRTALFAHIMANSNIARMRWAAFPTHHSGASIVGILGYSDFRVESRP